LEVGVNSEDLDLRETFIFRGFDMGPEVVPLDKVVARPVGDALLCGKLESTVVVLKDSGADRVGGRRVLANTIEEFNQQTTDWNEHTHAAAEGSILTLSCGQSDLCDELRLPD